MKFINEEELKSALSNNAHAMELADKNTETLKLMYQYAKGKIAGILFSDKELHEMITAVDLMCINFMENDVEFDENTDGLMLSDESTEENVNNSIRDYCSMREIYYSFLGHVRNINRLFLFNVFGEGEYQECPEIIVGSRTDRKKSYERYCSILVSAMEMHDADYMDLSLYSED